MEERPSPSTSNSGNEACFFDGDPDLYGLGIRSGVYITSFATILASVYEQKTAIELCKVAGLFQLAVFVALVRETIASNELYAVEALVTYLFCLSSLGISFGDPVGTKHYSPNYLEKKTLPNLVSLLRQLTILAVGFYQAWFWFLGVDKLQRLPCGTDTFFLARADMYGPFRAFAKIWSILIIVGLVLVIAFRLLSCPLQQREVPTLLKLLTAGCIIAMVISAVELTLKWNNVRGVNDVTSAGQLIPLIVGTGTFIGMVLNWERRDNARMPI